MEIVSGSKKGWAHRTYSVSFANGLTFTTPALDREDAQELAIDAMERAGVVHDSIVSIQVTA
jgi:hypothetical protein